jgi:tetratricopeptide (TPR) repeat protein
LEPDDISLIVALRDLPAAPESLHDVAVIFDQHLQIGKVAEVLFSEAIRLGFDPDKIKKTQAIEPSIRLQPPDHDEPSAVDLFRKTGHLTVLPTLDPSNSLVSEVTIERADVESWDNARLLSEFETNLAENRIQNAAVITEFFTRRNPDSTLAWDLWTTVGLKCFQAASFEAAKEAYAHALKLRPEYMASWFNQGVTLHYLRKLPEALEHYSKAARIDPQQSKVWCNLGALHFELGTYEESEKASRKAVELRPEYVRAWDNLAVALGSSGKWNEAAEACHKTLEIDPNSLSALLKLAIIHFYDSDYPEADAAFARTEVDPRFRAISLAYRAICGARTDQFEQSRDLCKRLHQEQSDAELEALAWNELSVAYYTAEKYEDAAACSEAAIARKTEFPKAWFNLGLARQQLGQMELARKAFTAAAKLVPDDAEVRKLAEASKRPRKQIKLRR